MYYLKLALAAAAFGSALVSCTEQSAPFGLEERDDYAADPQPSGHAGHKGDWKGDKWKCDSDQLNKVCSADFETKFDGRLANMTTACKGMVTQARTTVCDTWKSSSNATQSCESMKEGWKAAREAHCLPEHKHGQHGQHQGHCNGTRLDQMCQPDFLPKLEQRMGPLNETCNATITNTYTSVCNTWKTNNNASEACKEIFMGFREVRKQGCLPHHEGMEGKGDDMHGPTPSGVSVA